MTTSTTSEWIPVTMEQALGYSSINSEHQNPVEHSLVLKHNRYFLIAEPHGDIQPPGHCFLGLFFDDTRVLSHYALRFLGGPPSLLSKQIPRSFYGQVDLAILDSDFGGDNRDPKNCVHIRRELLLGDRLTERLTLTNYMVNALDYWFELDVGCDFADIFEIRGWKRDLRGDYFAPRVGDGKMVFSYRGLDGRQLQSTVAFCEPFPEFDSTTARWRIRMEPNSQFQTEWQIYAEKQPSKVIHGCRFDDQRQELNRIYEDWNASCTRWKPNVAGLHETMARAVDDIRALYVEAEGTAVISAGIPWFSTIFGRDSIITSLQTLSLNPGIARQTLHYLARHQGTKEDPFTEEEPGKIIHELRRGEMARNKEIPFIPYYGTIDATPLWLILLHETWRWTGDTQMVRDLLPNAKRALEWIDRYGDIDGDGFVEYRQRSARGLPNQGWKDSNDGVPYPDGTMPKAPIALVEVQGYVYDAKIRMAEIYDLLAQPDTARKLRHQAAVLREAIVARFWMDDIGTFALALDGDKKLLETIASNAGHLLWSGVPDEDQARRMAGVLMGPSMFSGWGIRTLSSMHPVFNPMSYHNGSVWPHDNAIIIMGLSRYRHATSTLPVVRGLYEAAVHDESQRLPELFCGMPRGHGKHPVLYPVSCSPQAWASGSFFMILQAMLGIKPEADLRTLHILNPVLPDFLDELTLSNLSVGHSTVSLQFSRYRDRTLANLLSISGEPLQVQIELN